MPRTRKILLRAACLLAIAAPAARHAAADQFTAFGEDEDICRQAGTAAIQGASGAAAAQRYDAAHAHCMAAHLRMRLLDAYRNAAPPYPAGGPPGFGFPDAFYHIPYATPGYGYDGFSH